MKTKEMLVIAAAGVLPTLAQADTFCVKNIDTITWYYSVRAKDGSGNSNYQLTPGESHQFSFNEPTKYYVCASKEPMTSDCPKRAELVHFPRC